MKYDQPEAGQWVKPTRRGYKLACCDCGLVHILDFDVQHDGRGSWPIFRVRKRDNRATAMVRRWMKKTAKSAP